MVCHVGDVADLFLDRGRVGHLETEFIKRRNLVQRTLLDPTYVRYIHNLSFENLGKEKMLYNSLVLEASRLDDEYRKIALTDKSDPNYEQLMVMYSGIKKRIQREISSRRENYSSFE